MSNHKDHEDVCNCNVDGIGMGMIIGAILCAVTIGIVSAINEEPIINHCLDQKAFDYCSTLNQSVNNVREQEFNCIQERTGWRTMYYRFTKQEIAECSG